MCLFAISLAPAFGQGITLAGSGYSDPFVIHVAPGQITTLFVTGLQTVLSGPANATSLPLPIRLAGVSVALKQGGNQAISVPLLSVQQVSVCDDDGATSATSGQTADCLITAITIQVPLELLVLPLSQTVPELVVSENGGASKAFKLSPVADNLHVINTCDVFPAPKVALAGFCQPLVTHASGDLITADNPARAGEEVVIWAFGLGQTNQTAHTGQASPIPAATLASPLYLRFDFTSNATPSPPFFNQMSGTPPPAAVFAGLTPGQIGLYQINVILPSTIPAVNACGATCPRTRGLLDLYFGSIEPYYRHWRQF